MIRIARSLADVYRICKECWMSTKHDVLKDEATGTTIYRCIECGFQFKEEDNDG